MASNLTLRNRINVARGRIHDYINSVLGSKVIDQVWKRLSPNIGRQTASGISQALKTRSRYDRRG